MARSTRGSAMVGPGPMRIRDSGAGSSNGPSGGIDDSFSIRLGAGAVEFEDVDCDLRRGGGRSTTPDRSEAPTRPHALAGWRSSQIPGTRVRAWDAERSRVGRGGQLDFRLLILQVIVPLSCFDQHGEPLSFTRYRRRVPHPTVKRGFATTSDTHVT